MKSTQGSGIQVQLTPIAALVRGVLLPAASLALSLNTAVAGPEGGQVVGGQGNIVKPDVNTTVINQQTHNLAVDWTSFNVAKEELVQFNQPSKTANALNRIFDQNPSQIFGSINANGDVYSCTENNIRCSTLSFYFRFKNKCIRIIKCYDTGSLDCPA